MGARKETQKITVNEKCVGIWHASDVCAGAFEYSIHWYLVGKSLDLTTRLTHASQRRAHCILCILYECIWSMHSCSLVQRNVDHKHKFVSILIKFQCSHAPPEPQRIMRRFHENTKAVALSLRWAGSLRVLSLWRAVASEEWPYGMSYWLTAKWSHQVIKNIFTRTKWLFLSGVR